jgi:citrate synthase
MSDEHVKTPADHIGNTVAQLKEMRHYSKHNVETLTAAWLLFDGELSKLKLANKIGDLMDRQGQLHEALENAITDLEEVLEKMKPEPEAEA